MIEIAAEDALEDCDEKYLKTLARALPATAARFLSVPAHEHQPKREVFLQMSFQKVHIQPPMHGDCLRKTDLVAWVIRVWETHPPQGQEPLEWILLTTVPILSPADAWEVVQWYRWRWRMSDFHKALKTGCRMEQRSLQCVEALWKLVAILTPIALRLLLIRQAAQQTEDVPAAQVVSQDVISVMIHLDPRHRQIVTAKQLWHAIARLGGYLDRTCDGPPGWQTLWKGWMRVMQTLEGVRFACQFSSS